MTGTYDGDEYKQDEWDNQNKKDGWDDCNDTKNNKNDSDDGHDAHDAHGGDEMLDVILVQERDGMQRTFSVFGQRGLQLVPRVTFAPGVSSKGWL